MGRVVVVTIAYDKLYQLLLVTLAGRYLRARPRGGSGFVRRGRA